MPVERLFLGMAVIFALTALGAIAAGREGLLLGFLVVLSSQFLTAWGVVRVVRETK